MALLFSHRQPFGLAKLVSVTLWGWRASFRRSRSQGSNIDNNYRLTVPLPFHGRTLKTHHSACSSSVVRTYRSIYLPAMSDDGAPVVEKRGRGRTAKDKKKAEPVEEKEKAPSPAAKKRGRAAKDAPKKVVDTDGDDEVPVKRGRGRPKKKAGAAAAPKGKGRGRPKKEEKKEESEEEEQDGSDENGDE
ncbi:hypothetical protein GE061_014879 [Apolygus lucorum]|uniref:Uncharacterized protein n=1 Tax=Apolygus lucorum TaxID=248454 RepID=A0A6A4JIY6_APOLU|nr:hypothetical protein GE061_014879 [Apolygus lucorum]